MNKSELFEAFRLYQKMVEDKARREWDDMDLRHRFFIGLFLFFVSYSILLTISIFLHILGV